MTWTSFGNLPLGDLSVDDVKEYLLRTGWIRRDYFIKHLLVFESQRKDDKGNTITLVLPSRNAFLDWPARLIEAIDLVAAVENRPHEVIFREMYRAARHDILKVRVHGDATAAGSLSLDLAAQIIQGLRNLVALSASVETDTRRYIKKILPVGTKWARQFRFAHTLPGSFCFAIETPPIKAPSHSKADMPIPFERKIMERIARGSVLTKESVQRNDLNILTDNYNVGLNANMCEVLWNITRIGHDIELEFSWAPILKPSEGLQEANTILLDQNSSQYLWEAARVLQTEPEFRRVTIEGEIRSLWSGSLPASEPGKRKVYIEGRDERGEKIKVHVFFEDDDYRKACDAHRDGRPVSVSGKLHKPDKSWILRDPYNFRSLPGDETTDAPPPRDRQRE